MAATAAGALVIILVGALLRRLGLVGPDDGPVLIRIVIWAALPALIVLILVDADLDGALVLVPVAGFLVHFVLLGLAWALARLRGLDDPTTGAWMVATAVGNTGFFGLPLIAASGAGFSLAAAVMYDSLATGIITWTSTVAVASAYGARGGGAARIEWLRLVRALTLPPTWALAVGLGLNLAGVEQLPEAVDRPLEILAGATLPLVMIYAGLRIEARGWRRHWVDVATISVIRLVPAALLGWLIGTALGFDGEILATVTVMAAMPTAMMSLVIGSEFGLRDDVIASAVVVTTLVSTLTLPVIGAVLT